VDLPCIAELAAAAAFEVGNVVMKAAVSTIANGIPGGVPFGLNVTGPSRVNEM
jgi:hypothetical protein